MTRRLLSRPATWRPAHHSSCCPLVVLGALGRRIGYRSDGPTRCDVQIAPDCPALERSQDVGTTARIFRARLSRLPIGPKTRQDSRRGLTSFTVLSI